MSYTDESIQTLVKFGLTSAQAKTYLTLLRLATSSISEISKASKVARPDTYRAISVLHERGLVEKVLGKPSRYKPLSIKNAVRVLLQQRERESIEISNRASKLVRRISQSSFDKVMRESGQFVLVPGGDAVSLEIEHHAGAACKNICVLTPRRKFQAFIANGSPLIRNAIDRKVSVRIVTDMSQADDSEEITSLVQSPFFELYLLPNAPLVWLAIVDDKETMFATSAKLDYLKSPALLSDNPVLVEFVRSYFSNVMSTAVKFIPRTDRSISKDPAVLSS